ncbi:hypothetical protein [Oikeobacillus pervagus]|nr:hypothetical protein [Oikeobacillus pervagus]
MRKLLNEKGATLPYTLLLFFLLQVFIFLGVNIYLSKYTTANDLAQYYETKTVELLALKSIIPQISHSDLEPIQGSYSSSFGLVQYEATAGEEIVELNLTTIKKDGSSFSSHFLYNKENNTIEHVVEQ